MVGVHPFSKLLFGACLSFNMHQHPLQLMVVQIDLHQFVDGLASRLAARGYFLQFCVKELKGALPIDELMEFGMDEFDELGEEEGDDLLPWAVLFVPRWLTHKMCLRCYAWVSCQHRERMYWKRKIWKKAPMNTTRKPYPANLTNQEEPLTKPRLPKHLYKTQPKHLRVFEKWLLRRGLGYFCKVLCGQS